MHTFFCFSIAGFFKHILNIKCSVNRESENWLSVSLGFDFFLHVLVTKTTLPSRTFSCITISSLHVVWIKLILLVCLLNNSLASPLLTSQGVRHIYLFEIWDDIISHLYVEKLHLFQQYRVYFTGSPNLIQHHYQKREQETWIAFFPVY